jgi:hypothetical protein
LRLQLNSVHVKVREIIQKQFFDGDISSESSSDNEGEKDNAMPRIQNAPLAFHRMDGSNAQFLGNIFQRPQRDRIMSEIVDTNNYNRNRTYSIFDLLLNNKTRDSANHIHKNLRNMQSVDDKRDGSESSNFSSSILENLLTEYLISLPSSLDEFYKIMGEIYVSELLRQYPQIGSPTELMKKTLLGNRGNDSVNNSSSIINALLQHVLQINTQQKKGLNPIESDLMRKLLTERNASQTPQPMEVDIPQPPNNKVSPPSRIPSVKEENKHKVRMPSKIQESLRNKFYKQESKQIEVRSPQKSKSESGAVSKTDVMPQILEHGTIIEQAKRLLQNKEKSNQDVLP